MAQPRNSGRLRDSKARWSQRVTQHSNALDLDPGVFTWDDPLAIAQSLKRSAEHSQRRKTTAFRSAMSMLTFYVNRAGRQLPPEQRARLEAAKDELRALFDHPRQDSRLRNKSRK
jgi:Zn-dependent oligopeptidase